MRTLYKLEFWLILPEATAIGVRLSHASREVQDLGILLSNTWTTYPMEGDNPGKLGIIPHRLWKLECSVVERPSVVFWLTDFDRGAMGSGLELLVLFILVHDLADRSIMHP